MASQKLTDLAAATSTGTGDIYYLVQGGVDKQIDFDDMDFGGGGGVLEYQSETTATTTVLDGTQEGLNKVYPFNKSTAQTIQIDKDDYIENDVINIERRGEGTVEVLMGTDVIIRGVRDIENRYFINDNNSLIALLCRGSNVFTIIGNLKQGYTGAVTTSSYSELLDDDVNEPITVIGTGFSSNMKTPILTGDGTLISWVYVSFSEITLYITSTGVADDTITVEYDNGDVFIDTNAITISATPKTYNDYTTWLKLDETSGTTATNQGAASDGTLVGGVAVNQTGQINKAYLFDGTDDYMTFTDNLGVTGFPLTVKAWIKAGSLAGTEPIFTTDNATWMSGFNVYSTGAKIGALIGMGTSNSAGFRRIITTDNDVLTVDTWHQIVVIFNAVDDVDIYVDSVSAASTSSGTGASMSLSDDTEVGRNNRASLYASLDIYDIAAWDRALTTTEIDDIFALEDVGSEMI